MHLNDAWSQLRLGVCGKGTDLDVGELVVVNTSHVNGTFGVCDELAIVTGNATIGSTVDKGTAG